MAQHKDLVGNNLHIARFASGAGSPVGVVTPGIIGQVYYDTTNGLEYIATGLTSANWYSPLGARLTELIKGESGKNVKIVAGVIRNDGSGWAFIENSTHNKLNFASISADTSSITLGLGFTAKKVISFVACPDERFAQLGYQIGASVGVTSAIIDIYTPPKSIGAYIRYNGSAWDVTSLAGNIAVSGFASGVLTVTHDDVVNSSYMASVTGRDGIYIPQFGSVGATTSQIKFYDFAGTLADPANTNMKCFFERSMPAVKLNPQNIIDATGDIWCIGVFEID